MNNVEHTDDREEAIIKALRDMHWSVARLERALLYVRADLLHQGTNDGAVQEINLALNAVHERLNQTIKRAMAQ